MGLLDGKVVLITGAARGQGRAHAVASAREGADVVLVDVASQLKTVTYDMAGEDDLARTVADVEALDRRALAVVADVRHQGELDEAVRRGLAEFGRVDCLIANAGIWTSASFWELTDEQWEETVGVNLAGVWRSAKAVAPHMMQRGSGSIVVISSVNGLEPGQNAHYAASKHGAIGLMKNMALELAPYGVRVNAICPGAINTPMTNHPVAWDMFAGHPGGTEDDLVEGGYRYHVLKGRTFLPPSDVADTAVYLNSRLADSVTGVTIPVDAGHLLLTGYNHHPNR